jgi:UDP-glucuronate decarboxylase
MSRRILITGGAGFLGGHLAAALARDPANDLTLLDDFSRGRDDAVLAALAAESGVCCLTGDVTDVATYAKLGRFDEVYHLAAIVGVKHVLRRPGDVLRVNAIGTLRLLDWCCAGGGSRLLFASTSEVYAWTQLFHPLPVPTGESVPLALTDLSDPRCTYAGSKIFGELAVTQICGGAGTPFVIVRYHNVYGPRMGRDHVIPELHARLQAGERPLAVYSADHRRAFCYVSDAVDATIAAMRCGDAASRTINIGNDREEINIGALATLVMEVAGIQTELEPRAAANDPIVRRAPDLTLARALLGYEPRVSLREGVERTLQYYGAGVEVAT